MESGITEEMMAKAAKAPRISKADVERAIRESKVTFTVLPNGRTTICQIELFGGRFSVEGDSACVSKENFSKLYGENHAFAQAEDKVWGVLGTVLAWRLAKIDSVGAAEGKITEYDGLRTYVGTKVVHGVPMTRGDYNALRGWDLPAGESGDDAGYLVEYTDGGGPNVTGFPGYISWSPKDVFERSYSVGLEPRPSTWLERLNAEVQFEENKLLKLTAFVATEKFSQLPSADQRDLIAQKNCMEEYVWLLKKRIRRAA
nr:Gp49 family protein [Caballeronia sp. TF1N1]